MDALRVWWHTLGHTYQWLYRYVLATMLWALLTALIIPAPAAWAGLIRLSHAASQNLAAPMSEFWAGFRENFLRSLPLLFINAVLLYITWFNFLGYSAARGVAYDALRVAWILILWVWIAIQFYAFPIMLEMERPTLSGALRNAAVMIFLNPIFTLLLWVGVVIAAIISTLLPGLWLVVTGGLLAVLATTAVLNRLEKFRISRGDSTHG